MLVTVGLGGLAPAGTACCAPMIGGPTQLDQVTAQMPGDEAEIASVMLAELNIALHRAKKQAADKLCQGNWLPEGRLVRQVGPLPATLEDGTNTWIYQVARSPVPLACEQVSRSQFFQEMSRYLPDWVTIRPAGQSTTYRQGFAQFSSLAHLATR